MTTPLPMSVDRARQLSVLGQLLSLPRPATVETVVRDLGTVQIDPTSSVARTEHLVLFSRLGRRYRKAELDRLLWEDRSLFQFRAHIVPAADYAIHRVAMRRFPNTDSSRHRYVRQWLTANQRFHRHVLSELRRRGPLRTRDLEDLTAEGWRTGGWNDNGKSTAMMLEALSNKGEVAVAGRDGQQRLWDLAERWHPRTAPAMPAARLARAVVERQLRARGVAPASGVGFLLDGGQIDGSDRALTTLVRAGAAVPVAIEGQREPWYAHAEVLERTFRPRTVLLSPFDRLIHDRRRTKLLFGFDYQLEIYIPKDKRRYGYYVLPILHGDRLIGRIDPVFDRPERALRVNGLWAEDEAPASAGAPVARAIRELAAWLGAVDISFAGPMPPAWRRAVRA